MPAFTYASKPTPQKKYYGTVFKHKVAKSLPEVLKSPQKFEGKHIQVKGKITKVCPMSGCWIDIEDPKTKKTMHVKVKDHVIVFPKDSVKKNAVVEGTLVKKVLSVKKAIAYYKHRAEELKMPFDPKTITGPVTLWELKGTAASIE